MCVCERERRRLPSTPPSAHQYLKLLFSKRGGGGCATALSSSLFLRVDGTPAPLPSARSLFLCLPICLYSVVPPTVFLLPKASALDPSPTSLSLLPCLLSDMATLVLLVLLSAFVGGSDATWCVCRSDVSQAAQQKTLDYACGAGADCTPILQNGVCYNPNTVLAHCSYAANSYFQRKGQAVGSCDFSGGATIVTSDPSYTGCTFPSSATTAGTATNTPFSGTPTGTGTGTTTTTTGTPSTFTPNTNGVIGGLGPSGGFSDPSTAAAAGIHFVALPTVTILAGLVLLRLRW